jgi:methionyl-tRNA formyltransferase
MNFVYLASGLFGQKVLSYLNPQPSLVITQADKPGGRGMKTLIPTEIKKYCLDNNLKFKEIAKGRTLEGQALEGSALAGLILVCDFGLIIPSSLLSQNSTLFLNLHPSLLPKYRGPSPIQSALLNDETETGVSLMQLDEQIDHGPILVQEKCLIDLNDNNLVLMNKLAKIGAKLFNRFFLTLQPSNSLNPLNSPTLRQAQGKTFQPLPQDHSLATYTKKFSKTDSFVNFIDLAPYLTPLFQKYHLSHLLQPDNLTTLQPFDKLRASLCNPNILHNHIRAFTPFPLVWTTLPNGKVLKILSSHYALQTKNLTITEIQIEGKRYSEH